MTRHRQWHVSGWPAALLAPLAIPVIFLIKLGEVFGLKTSADLTARDVSSYLDDFINARSGDWDWDDFTSIRIADPNLESIRVEAASIELPLDESGELKLRQLLERSKELEAPDVAARPA